MPQNCKVGFVTILGRPNVGKSTLLNAILNYKVAITSKTPQTTRNQIKGIYNDQEAQIIFIDTPGIHKPRQMLGQKLNATSYQALKGVDLVLFLQPADEALGPGDKYIIAKIAREQHKVALITKVDLNHHQAALTKKAHALKALGFELVLGVSNQYPPTIKALIKEIKTFLPVGPKFYDEDAITDVSMRFVAKELIRESAIELLFNELPHALGVVIEEFLEGPEIIKISASLCVVRQSQKLIVVGEKGNLIKKIGIQARQKIAAMTGQKVHLELFVKVDKNWHNDAHKITKMGY